jgi:RND family efflux transporter MFP subunit
VARQEYELLGEDIPGANKDLILREPQMDTARADIASAEARVRQARLDLQRTTVNAPFDGKVVTEDVDLGTNLSTQDRIARLVGTDRYWVELAVPAAQLRWIDAAETEGTEGSPVILRNPSVWPSNATRRGVVREVLPDLSDRGRMARLLVEVRDPLAREPETAGKPGLLLGAYLRAEVRGRVLRDVVAVEREHLRQDDTVWIMNETDALEIRAVQIVYRGNDEVYVDAGVSDGERIVTSPIPSAAAGMPLRTREPQA